MKQYGVFGTLNRVQSTYPFIHSIGIYNGLNNTYLNTKGITKEQEKALLEEINSKNTSYFHLFLARSLPPLPLRPTGRRRPYFRSPSELLFAAKLQRRNRNQHEHRHHPGSDRRLPQRSGGFAHVIDDKGTIITHSDRSRFMENISQESYVQSILESDAESGYFTRSIDGRKSLVTYVKSRI